MKKLLLSFFIASFAFQSFASHNMAGYISYQRISGYTYEITVKTFTDIGPGVTADRCELTFLFGDGDSAIVPRSNGPSILCPSGHDGVPISACTGSVKLNIYSTTHTFSGPSRSYHISVTDPNRSAGICNIINSVNTPFLLEADLIISSFFANSSPTYNNIPVNCDTIGVPSYYNPTCLETEGDSLFYDFGICDPTWTYPAYSSSFAIDHATGIVSWISPVSFCIYVYDIRVTEWRNVGGTAYYLGSTMEEVWNDVSVYSGINESESPQTSITVFPNPSNENVNFSINNGNPNEEYSLEICNSIGQLIKALKINPDSPTTIPQNQLSPGVYFYSLKTENSLLTNGKFIISGGSLK